MICSEEIRGTVSGREEPGSRADLVPHILLAQQLPRRKLHQLLQAGRKGVAEQMVHDDVGLCHVQRHQWTL